MKTPPHPLICILRYEELREKSLLMLQPDFQEKDGPHPFGIPGEINARVPRVPTELFAR